MKMVSVFDIPGTSIKTNDTVEVLDVDHDNRTITIFDSKNECWISVDETGFIPKADNSPELKILQSAILAAQQAVDKIARGPIDDVPYGSSQVRITPLGNSKIFKLLKQFEIGFQSNDVPGGWVIPNPGNSFMLSLKSKEAGSKAFAKVIQKIRDIDPAISISIESVEELQP